MEDAVQSSNTKERVSANATEQKRKYRRHPKPDENAPEKPPSAYVLFSNRIREEVKADNLSFTEIARLVGERWQNIDPSQKEMFESHASSLKENYNKELTDYKKTDAYKEYMQYLAEFKAKNAAQGETKRPKLDHHGSSSLSGGTSAGENPEALAHQIPGHARQLSNGSASVTSQAVSSTLPSIATIPLTNVPSRRRGTSPHQYFPERRLITQASTQSSISEDSSTPRFDPTDALSRASALSIGTSPGASPSPSTTMIRSGRRDYGFGSVSQPWLNRQTTYGFSAPEAAATSPSGITDHWHDRGADASYYTVGPSIPAQQTNSVPISQLIDPYHGQDSPAASSQRTLPPLRQSAGTTTTKSASGFVGLATPNAVHSYSYTNEAMAYRQGPARNTPNQSESEAADTLAALADREHSYSQSRTPRPQQDPG